MNTNIEEDVVIKFKANDIEHLNNLINGKNVNNKEVNLKFASLIRNTNYQTIFDLEFERRKEIDRFFTDVYESLKISSYLALFSMVKNL